MSDVGDVVEVVKKVEPTVASTLQSVVDELVKVKEQHGEQIASTVLETSSLMAMNELTQAIAGLGFILLLSIPFIFLGPKKIKNEDRYSYHPESCDARFMGKIVYSTIYIVIVMVVGSVCFSQLANPINWKGVVKPEVYLTYHLLKKAK